MLTTEGNDTMAGDAGDDVLIGVVSDDSHDGGADVDHCNGAIGDNSYTDCEQSHEPRGPPNHPSLDFLSLSRLVGRLLELSIR